jgi:RsiW-degrading membrane proteinase PrsW (M82 family)
MAQIITLTAFVFFGIAPAIIWLLFYLRKDAHPESKKMVLKMFFYGMLAVIVAAIIEVALFFTLGKYFFPGINLEGFSIGLDPENFNLTFFLIEQFIIIALVEELCKFFIVKFKVLNHPEFDEPVDAMLYMIIVALGFAALENVLYLQSLEQPYIFDMALLSSFRFLGANFLHALCSGIVGYFLAISILECKGRFIAILKGIIIAVMLHGLFNISIMKVGRGIIEKDSILLYSSSAFLIILLSVFAFLVSYCFKKLKKMKSTCNTK